MNKLAMSALAATALISVPALAQNAPAGNPGAAMTVNQQQVANLWRASKLDGVNIYNNNNEKIGEIDDVLIDHNGKAMAVVVDVGGFLGMGEHRVALKFEDVKFSDQPMNNSTAARSTNNNNVNTANTTTGAAPNAPAGAPPSTVSTASNNNSNNNRMYPDHATLNMTKDQLKALPQISYSR